MIIVFSFLFTLRYQEKRHRDYLVTLVCSISLIIALLTASLLPTDVILVTFMKNPNGTFKVRGNRRSEEGEFCQFKEWATNETVRDHIQKYVEIGYYGTSFDHDRFP